MQSFLSHADPLQALTAAIAHQLTLTLQLDMNK
jgi:hypothetical protein